MIKTPLSTVIGGAFWTPGATIIGSTSATLNTIIKSIFLNNDEGFAYDPNDLTTLYQDAAGTIPVTAAGQPVGLVLDKSKGLVLGAELVVNGDFGDGLTGWVAYEGTTLSIVGGKIQVVNGSGSGAYAYQGIPTVVGKTYKLSVDIEAVDNSEGAISVGSAFNQVDVASKVQRTGTLNIIFTAKSSVSYLLLQPWTNEIGRTCLFDNVSVKELVGNHAYQTVSASRPLLQRNATTGAYYLAFDGVDDSLQTNSIDFTATDKVSLFAGVRKLSDATFGILVELSASSASNSGAFAILAPAGSTGDYGFRSGGSSPSTASEIPVKNLAPSSNVITGIGSISTDKSELRINGVSIASSSVDQGVGNYGNYPLYIARRSGASAPFNGHLYSLIGIGRLTTNSETIALEKSIAKNTGATLSV